MDNFKEYVPYKNYFLYIIIFYIVVNVTSALFASEQDRLFWNKRYDTETYILGKEPVEFLKEHINILPGGKALDIAMGEGRNAVFLAKRKITSG